MYTFILAIHVIVCVLLILVVLVQPSKGGGFAIYGGGGDALFSTGSGTSFMKNFTGGCAVVFACTSLLLTLMSSRAGTRSVTNKVPLPAPMQSMPNAPTPPSLPGNPAPPQTPAAPKK